MMKWQHLEVFILLILGTTVTLFDDNLKLREGKFNLLLWPNVLPDYGFESKVKSILIHRLQDWYLIKISRILIFVQTN